MSGNPRFLALTLIAAFPLLTAADTYEYDALGRLRKVTYANATSTSYTLDAVGNRTTPGSGSPTYVAITSSSGAILPAAASLYTVVSSCNGYPAVCTWMVRKLYGNGSAAITVVHAPNGVAPACNYGSTTQITAGYVRTGCSLTALSTVFGQ